MRKLFCIVAVLACVSTAGVVCAKTWFLPDYQTGELQKKGYQDRGQGNAQSSVNRTNNFGCGAYNATDQDDVGTQDCDSRFRLSNGRWCYLGCCQPCNPSSYTTSQSVRNSIAEPCTDECNGTTYYYPSDCKDDYYKSTASCGDDDTRCVYSISSPDSYGCGSCSYACNSAKNYVSSCSTNYTQCKAIFGDQGPCGSLTCGTCTLDCKDGYVTGCTNPTNGSATLINTAKCGSKTCGICSYSCNTKYYLSGTTCNKCQFTGYPLPDKSAENATDFGTSPECGRAYQYKVTACANGLQPNSAGDGCSPCSCPFTGYPLPSKSAENATDFDTSPACCGNYQYKVTACATKYTVKSDGSGCDKCQFTGYPLPDKSAENATDFGTSPECGRAYQYKVTACANGLQPNSAGDGCSPCSCPFTGYPLPSKSAENATDFDTSPACCGNYQYKVTACASGYEVNSDGSGCKASCPASCTKTCPANSTCTAPDACGCVTVTGCNTGFGMFHDTSKCGAAPDNGYWTVGKGNTCEACTLNCNDGCSLIASTNSCICLNPNLTVAKACENLRCLSVQPAAGGGYECCTSSGSGATKCIDCPNAIGGKPIIGGDIIGGDSGGSSGGGSGITIPSIGSGSNCGQLADVCSYLNCSSGCVKLVSGSGSSACYECSSCNLGNNLFCPMVTGKL